MTVAVAKRPVEQFETQVPMPDWQLTPEEEMFGDAAADQNAFQPMVDENGNPLQAPPEQQPGAPPPMIRSDGTGEPTQQELDQAFPPGTQQQPQPRQRPPEPHSTRPAEPSEPRAFSP
jgi:penicillin-binding protein 1A